MPKRKLPKLDVTEEEGRRQLGQGAKTRHPGLQAAKDLLADQAPPRNLPGTKPRPTGKSGVGPDTSI